MKRHFSLIAGSKRDRTRSKRDWTLPRAQVGELNVCEFAGGSQGESCEPCGEGNNIRSPGNLAGLDYQPSHEMRISTLETSARGRVHADRLYRRSTRSVNETQIIPEVENVFNLRYLRS